MFTDQLMGTVRQNFAAYGAATTLAGLEVAIKALQSVYDEIRMEIAAAQGRHILGNDDIRVQPASIRRRITRGKSDGKRGWGNMTPEERSIEMKRRQALTRSLKVPQTSSIDSNESPKKRTLTPEQKAHLSKVRRK